MSRRRRSSAVRQYDNTGYMVFGEQANAFEIELGYGLVDLLEEENDSSLLKEIDNCRNKLDAEYGIPLPPVTIRDNIGLDPCEYSILFYGAQAGKFSYDPNSRICIDTGDVKAPIETKLWKKTKDPVFDMPAFFVPKDLEHKYKQAGYACPEPQCVIRVHFYETAVRNRHRILNQCIVNNIINKVRSVNPDVVDDVFLIRGFSTSSMKILLNALLKDDISIRDMNTILETVSDYMDECKNPTELAEKARKTLAPGNLRKYADDDKVVHTIAVTEKKSNELMQKIKYSQSYIEPQFLDLDFQTSKELIDQIVNICLKVNAFVPVVVCKPELRLSLSRFLFQSELNLSVCVSFDEVAAAKKDFNICIKEEGCIG